MYRKLSLKLLVPHPENANRMSRTYAKKLRHGIEQIGRYEIITVRPHPTQDGKFEVLNGHSRLEALRTLGISEARCDVWNVTDSQARLFLAILNKLRGSEVPELRMSLLSGLLGELPSKELAAFVPENAAYLGKIERLAEGVGGEDAQAPSAAPDMVVTQFYLTRNQHRVVAGALEQVSEQYNLTDSSQALAKMAELYLEQSKANQRSAAA